MRFAALFVLVSAAVAAGPSGVLAADPPPPPGPAPGIDGQAPSIFTGTTGRVNLAKWYYRGDRGDVGLAQGWPKQRFPGASVVLPFVPNAWPVTGAAGVRNFNGSVGWYRTNFTVPKTGGYAIRFESVNHRAAVWLDGKLLGKHRGVYLPFEVRPQLLPGHQYSLVVRADWRNPVPGMKREGWHRGWFNYGGINREVSLRKLQNSEVEAPTIDTKVRADGSAHVRLTMRVQNRAGKRRVAPAGSLGFEGQAVPIAFAPQTMGAGKRAVFATEFDVPAAHLWSPQSPSLYDLRLFVPGEGGWQARVGLRELVIKNRHPWLNGNPVFLYGASLHEDVRGRGDALHPADQDHLVGKLKAIGANATRAQHALSPALLERLDAAGILVWQEIGPWDSPGNWLEKTKGLQREGLSRVHQSFEQLAMHPSVFAWNLGNEVGANGHPGQGWFVDTAARWLKARDPGRLTALDVWGVLLPKHSSLMYSHIDAIGTTSYFGWYEEPFAKPDRIRKLIRDRITYLRKVFPAKAILASEFGAEGNKLNPSKSHGGLAYQAYLLKLHIDSYVKVPDASGAMVWNLEDFGVNPEFGGGSILTKVRGIKLVRGLNQKGLFDSFGRAKPAAAAVTGAFKRARTTRG